MTVKECGFHGSFGIGTNDHTQGNDDNLVEDVWIWAAQSRIIAINYRSQRNVWRRVVVRGDGCGTPQCAGSGNPNVGITIYDSAHVTFENVLVVDRILSAGDEPYADFAVAQHTPGAPHGDNQWLGTLSIEAPDVAYYFEPDEVSFAPAQRLRDCIAFGAAQGGINVARSGTSDIARCTLLVSGGDGLRVAPELAASGSTVRDVIVLGAGRFGLNSAVAPSFANVFGTWSSGAYNQTACSTGCRSTDPRADGSPPSLRYLPRVEPGSALQGAGRDGGDIGANVVFRYGVEGTRYAETGFDALTGTPLWPWPYEARIKAQLCASTSRGFCSAPSLTAYVWGLLGNGLPPELTPDGGGFDAGALGGYGGTAGGTGGGEGGTAGGTGTGGGAAGTAGGGAGAGGGRGGSDAAAEVSGCNCCGSSGMSVLAWAAMVLLAVSPRRRRSMPA